MKCEGVRILSPYGFKMTNEDERSVGGEVSAFVL